ncbi:hypothetical protein NQD34_018241 [Periophthalmus magnuspinnatus]|nr:hypothetical protein NQD34_018241 [Periophthalmus magnuspinnatus]
MVDRRVPPKLLGFQESKGSHPNRWQALEVTNWVRDCPVSTSKRPRGNASMSVKHKVSTSKRSPFACRMSTAYIQFTRGFPNLKNQSVFDSKCGLPTRYFPSITDMVCSCALSEPESFQIWSLPVHSVNWKVSKYGYFLCTQRTVELHLRSCVLNLSQTH